MDLRVLRVKDVELPIQPVVEDPKLIELRDRFLKGDVLRPEELQDLVRRLSTRASNDNCNVC